ncbi:MAG: hypothetical protein A3J06_04635 [Candidatus Moranbacteria bacterium RIFCSPLOWO2_02_FULL_48_19]|nr:MAG: hypothetical protein A3J06_04635 [Candidatus Moranbacteria bacterium RIFCSPLOWO2_02_FULL_48_19]
MNKKTAPGNRGRYFLIGAVIVLTLLVVKQPSFLKSAYDLLREEALIIGDSSRNDLSQAEKILSAKAGEKPSSFSWKYKGRGYALDESLYESYYRFYKTLPVSSPANDASQVKWYTTYNEMFIAGAVGDDTIQVLAEKIRVLGEERKLNENQMVELVAAFVQTIPYDQGKLERRKSGLDGVTEKITYPYEVLYENTGVCQDKSYLAYALLKKLGYGVAIFLFPDPKDNHMAIGVKCPLQYSNYDSGYCFIETTSLGNKIGMIPDLIPQSRIATSDIQINTIDDSSAADDEYQPLGNIEILNTIDGKEYTGIIDTISTQRELLRLRKTIDVYKGELKALSAEIGSQEKDLDKMEKKMKSLKDDEKYDDYNDLVEKYNSLLSKVKKNIKAYNRQVAVNNAVVERYRVLANDFYR